MKVFAGVSVEDGTGVGVEDGVVSAMLAGAGAEMQAVKQHITVIEKITRYIIALLLYLLINLCYS